MKLPNTKDYDAALAAYNGAVQKLEHAADQPAEREAVLDERRATRRAIEHQRIAALETGDEERLVELDVRLGEARAAEKRAEDLLSAARDPRTGRLADNVLIRERELREARTEWLRAARDDALHEAMAKAGSELAGALRAVLALGGSRANFEQALRVELQDVAPPAFPVPQHAEQCELVDPQHRRARQQSRGLRFIGDDEATAA